MRTLEPKKFILYFTERFNFWSPTDIIATPQTRPTALVANCSMSWLYSFPVGLWLTDQYELKYICHCKTASAKYSCRFKVHVCNRKSVIATAIIHLERQKFVLKLSNISCVILLTSCPLQLYASFVHTSQVAGRSQPAADKLFVRFWNARGFKKRILLKVCILSCLV